MICGKIVGQQEAHWLFVKSKRKANYLWDIIHGKMHLYLKTLQGYYEKMADM